MIYSQNNRGYCSGYAIAHGIGKATGRFPVPDEVVNFYKRHDKGPEGMRTIEIAEIMKKEKFGGARCTDWDIIFDKDAKSERALKRNKDAFIKIHIAMRTPSQQVFLSVKTRKKNPKIPLGRDFYLKPYEDGTEDHALLLSSFIFGKYRQITGFEVVNSWGKDFGDKGRFYVQRDDFFKFSEKIYILTFA